MDCFYNSIILFSLYAEIHSSLPPIPNTLNNKIPEIIADIPIRINKDEKIPVLVLIKDAHMYPVELEQIEAVIFQNEIKIKSDILFSEYQEISEKLWYRIFYIESDLKGNMDIDIIFSLKNEKGQFKITNDSYKFSKKERLNVFVSSDSLPDSDRIIYGDIHYHSFYTEDVIEFGAPINAASAMAKSMGLSFFAVTDHSYDLDDSIENPGENDTGLSKWKNFLDECREENKKGIAVIPGIEVSAGNSKNKNVHFLVLNPQKFHHGSGDSSDIRLKTSPDNWIREIVKNSDKDELYIAAHPFCKVPFLEKLFLRRGQWDTDDLIDEKIIGLQIFDGIFDKYLKESLKKWIYLLLNGHRKFIYAGNDAHGNFNRHIQIKVPFISLKQSSDRVFGFMKTGIYAEKGIVIEDLLHYLKYGRCFVTSGPSIFFYLYSDNQKYMPGDEALNTNLKIHIDVKSIKEYGKLKELNLILGDLKVRSEIEYKFTVNYLVFSYEGNLPFDKLPSEYYVRIECKTENSFAYSNPVWVKS